MNGAARIRRAVRKGLQSIAVAAVFLAAGIVLGAVLLTLWSLP